MRVKIHYSKRQLEEAVNYVAKHNTSFLDQYEKIKNVILTYMREMALEARYRNTRYVGTMGFLILADREYEGLDSDENSINFEILVDPAVGCKDYSFTNQIITDEEK